MIIDTVFKTEFINVANELILVKCNPDSSVKFSQFSSKYYYLEYTYEIFILF